LLFYPNFLEAFMKEDVSLAKQSSAEKRHKQSLGKRARNRHIRSSVKTAVKDVRTAIAENPETSGEALKQAARVIARAGSKGVLHKRTAARKISRLAKATRKAGPPAK
jgi:small subunit ribosomal protein S20